MPLSVEKSPRPWSGNAFERLLTADKKAKEWTAPATADDLRELQVELRRAVEEDPRISRLYQHLLPGRLSQIDHLIAVHICGYVYRGDTGYAFERWQTSAGTYTRDATSKWTTDLDSAIALARRYSPHLRLDMRIGGARHGEIRKAKFSDKHPNLAGKSIPLPDEWATAIQRYPAAAIVDTFLTAYAMEKDALEAKIQSDAA